MPKVILPASQTKTWQYLVNYATGGSGSSLTDHRAVFLRIINGLTSFPLSPASVRGTSNGTTAGMDGVNRLVSTSDVVFNNVGSAFSWAVLRFTGIGSTMDVLFACNVADSNGRFMSVLYSPTGFSGGSTTTLPTAAAGDAVELWETNSINAVGWLHGSTSSLSMKVHLKMSTDGQNVRIHVFYNGVVVMFAAFDRLANARSGILNPWVCTWLSGSTTERATAAIYCLGMRPVSMRASPMGWPMAVRPCIPSSDNNFEPAVQGANDMSAEWPVWEIPVYDEDGVSELGTIPDMYIGSNSKTSADGYPASPAPRVWQHYKALIEPTDGTTIQTS